MKRFICFLALTLSFTALCGCKGGKKEKEGVAEKFSAVVGISQDLDSLDPHKAEAAGTNEVLFNVFEGLVKPTADGDLVPAVAKEVKVSEDGKTYSFVLRENVTFHNGKKVTPADVVYSIKRCAGLLAVSDPEVGKEAALSVIQTVEIQGENTIVISLSEPNTELLGFLTCAIIPEDYDNQEKAPVGTGPYCFVSYSPLESFVVKRYEDYYGEKPYLTDVTFKICSGNDAAFMELLAGRIDIFPYLTEEQASQLPKEYNVLVGASNLVQAVFLNNGREQFQNEKVRKALCYAVNKQELLDIVAGGRGNIIGSNMFPNFGLYYNEALESAYPYQPETAKQLLAEAGYTEKNPLSFTIKVPSNYDFHVATAQVIAEQLKKVGIDVKLQLVEWSVWMSEVYNGRDYDATIVCVDAALAPSDVLKRYVSTADNNFVNYENKEVDALYSQAVKSISTEEKATCYKKIQQILSEEAASVYLQDPAKLVAVKKSLTNYLFYPVYVLDLSALRPAE